MSNHSSKPNVDVDTELTDEQLDEVSGGIIIVGGSPVQLQQTSNVLNLVALNPQPLPPKYKGFRLF